MTTPTAPVPDEEVLDAPAEPAQPVWKRLLTGSSTSRRQRQVHQEHDQSLHLACDQLDPGRRSHQRRCVLMPLGDERNRSGVRPGGRPPGRHFFGCDGGNHHGQGPRTPLPDRRPRRLARRGRSRRRAEGRRRPEAGHLQHPFRRGHRRRARPEAGRGRGAGRRHRGVPGGGRPVPAAKPVRRSGGRPGERTGRTSRLRRQPHRGRGAIRRRAW